MFSRSMFLFAATALGLASTVAMSAQPQGSVLFIVPVLNDEAYVFVQEAAKEKAKEYPGIEWEFTAASSRNNVPEIIAKIEAGVVRGVDVIAIDPGEAGEQLVPALKRAIAAGVKVVLVMEPAPGL